jgi:hypothetical protein
MVTDAHGFRIGLKPYETERRVLSSTISFFVRALCGLVDVDST